MIKRNLISLGALGVFAVLAAGSTPDLIEKAQQAVAEAEGGGSGSGNHAACVRYVEHFNSLPCVADSAAGIDFDVTDMCPPELDMNPKDMAPYYDCMIANSKCKDNIPDLAGLSDCRP